MARLLMRCAALLGWLGLLSASVLRNRRTVSCAVVPCALIACVVPLMPPS